jgi:putative membrane protein
MTTWLRGALAGGLGTLAMTVVLLVLHRLGWLPRLAPRHVTARAEHQAGVRHQLTPSEFRLSWVSAHFGYGASAGVVYGRLHRLLPVPWEIAGPLFGLLVWAVSYRGLLPSLRLFPPPNERTGASNRSLILAHLVYGWSTAYAYARLGG